MQGNQHHSNSSHKGREEKIKQVNIVGTTNERTLPCGHFTVRDINRAAKSLLIQLMTAIPDRYHIHNSKPMKESISVILMVYE